MSNMKKELQSQMTIANHHHFQYRRDHGPYGIPRRIYHHDENMPLLYLIENHRHDRNGIGMGGFRAMKTPRKMRRILFGITRLKSRFRFSLARGVSYLLHLREDELCLFPVPRYE